MSELSEELERMRAYRYEMLTAYRELQEDMEMVISRVPAVGENPQYISEMAAADERMAKVLDATEPTLRALEALVEEEGG